MIVNEINSSPIHEKLIYLLNKMVSDGYDEIYKVTERGLESLHRGRLYTPEQIQVVNFFRFEGMSDPDDNAILYVLETNDGGKGTLIDGYGIYTEPRIASFMKEVESIQKKTVKS